MLRCAEGGADCGDGGRSNGSDAVHVSTSTVAGTSADRMKTVQEALPALRRYARALLGEGDLADEYVARSLAALISVDEAAAAPAEVGLRLFRLLHCALEKAPPHRFGEPPDGLAAIIMRLSVPERAVLLLRALEGLPLAAAAAILGIAETDAARRYRQATGTLRRLCFGNTVVIECDRHHVRYLSRLVQKAGCTVIGTAIGPDEAIAAVLRASPGLIVADISGCRNAGSRRALKWILDHKPVPIILVTGHSEHLQPLSIPLGAQVVTKPCRPADIRNALARMVPA